MPSEPPVLIQIVLGLVLSWHCAGVGVVAWYTWTGAVRLAVEESLAREVQDMPAEYHDQLKGILRPMLWGILIGFGVVYWPYTIRILREL